VNVDLVVVEVGSTLTKVRAFDRLGTAEVRFVGAGIALTTALTPDGAPDDAMNGVEIAVADLAAAVGEEVAWGRAMGTSSAAGGLRMTVHGLVESMTVRAAREAALGAGAIVKLVTAGALRQADLDAIAAVDPNIVLLAGGVDFGERETVVENAQALAATDLVAPVVFCGNVAARAEVEAIFARAGKRLAVTDNVYPRVDQLVVEPVREVIQQVFEEHITEAPGMERVRLIVDGPVMPTPGAVLLATEMLRGLVGDVMVVDVGGATTDVHSVTEGSPELRARALEPEPLAKRTVEGDLGVWMNAQPLLDAEETAGAERAAEGRGADVLVALPQTEAERTVAARLAARAVLTAVDRHAGRMIATFGPSGREERPLGRDLSAVGLIVGTGGALTRLPGGLEAVKEVRGRGRLHPPSDADALLDTEYLMSSVGVIARTSPDDASRLLARHVASTSMKQKDGRGRAASGRQTNGQGNTPGTAK
jgi:uncharacterized protein (TIGR01319 family)